MNEQKLPDLSLLLAQLRGRGITVGAPELQRLQTVFAHSPALSHQALRGLLCHLLAKDDHQRDIIQRNFDRLVPQDMAQGLVPDLSAIALHNQSAPATDPDTGIDTAQAKPAKRKKSRNFARISLLALIAAILLVIFLAVQQEQDADHRPVPSGTDNQTDNAATEKPAPAAKPISSDLKLVPTLDLWEASVKPPREHDLWLMLLPALLLLLGGGSGFVYLLYKTQQKTQQRQPLRPATPKGPGRSWLPGIKGQSFKLLSGPERREIAWGIGQRFNELPLRQLDIQRTVRRSAQQAMPQVVFQQSRRLREVWLWRERNSTNPDLAQLVSEIEQTLKAAGVVVQQAYFRGLPTRLTNGQGQVLHDIEQQRQQVKPITLLFLDAGLVAHYQQRQPVNAEKLLYQLGRWPNTAAVDAGSKQGQLHHHLKRYGLSCLLPAGVAQWLVQQSDSAPVTSPNREQLQLWAIACALPARVVLEEEARALHDELGLAVNWHFAALQRYNLRPGSDLEFGTNRPALLNQFAAAVQEERGWANTALNFWDRRYEAIDTQLTAAEKEDKSGQQPTWQGTTEQQRRVVLSRALLQLWHDPQSAADTLHDLHEHKDLQRDVEQNLALYRFTDQPGSTADEQSIITLRQPWDELALATQQQFIACGLGQVAKTLKIRADSLTRGLLGISAGLALAGLLGSLYAVYPQPTTFDVALNSAQPPAGAATNPSVRTEAAGDSLRYVAGSVKTSLKSGLVAADNHLIPLSWKKTAQRPAQIQLSDDGRNQLWLLGENAQPVRLLLPPDPDTPEAEQRLDWSIAVIGRPATENTARKLAAKLLDTGTVDQVIIGRDWRKKHAELLGAAKGLDTQWLYIAVDNPPSLYLHPAQRIAVFSDGRDLLKQLNQTNALQKADDLNGVLRKAKAVWLQGEKIAENIPVAAEIQLPDGLTLRRIPAGSFQMGSDNISEAEKPVREVTMGSFYMSQTEITFAQYDAYVADRQRADRSDRASRQKQDEILQSPKDEGWGRDNRPVINISWNDAQGYVQWLTETQQADLQGLQCRLPSEAEWEYAARAGTTTTYSWGDDIGVNQANCNGCGSQWDGKQTAPVGSFKANAFGLQDMHGNVWEWVQDRWHDNYNGAPADGLAWEAGDSSHRVLRGGSWYNAPYNLRSADRDGNNPDDRNGYIGFRVVCSPLSGR